MAEFTIVIAEDEKLIRDGIIKTVECSELNLEIVGVARNGTEAFRIIQDKNPDILLTDLKMAAGNGLELIKNVKAFNQDIKVIIISGYNNFEYAQQAIQLGVKDYILKPIDIDKLLLVLEKQVTEIRNDRNLQNTYGKLENFYQENRQLLVNEFYRDLLFGAMIPEEIETKKKLFEVTPKKSCYLPFILYTEIKNPIEWSSLKNDLVSSISPVLDHWNLNIESLFFMPNEIFYTDITFVISLEEIRVNIKKLLPEIKTAVNQVTEVSLLAMGIGELCTRLDELSFSYQKARTHALFSMISGLNSKNIRPRESLYSLPLSVYETTERLFIIFSDRNRKELNLFLDSIEKELNRKDTDLTHKRTLLRNLFVCVLSAGDELGIPVREFFPDLMALFRYINLKTLQELLTKIKWACDTIITQTQTREDRSGIDLMDRAKTYIYENFTDPLLSLEAVSAYLSLTPAYFSKLYKKAHGVSYIETLTQLRLEKAAEYLKNSPLMKISAIAANVGYNSPSYFNYIFKKNYGKSPGDYQNFQ